MSSRKSLAWMLGALLLLSSQVALAGEARPQEPSARGLGAGYFSVGMRWLDTGPLEERLEAAGFPAPGRRFLAMGGGGHSVTGRLLLGGEGYGLMSLGEASRRGDFRARLSGGYGLFRIGYALVSSESLAVFVLGGVGGGGVSLTLSPEQELPFDEVLADPRREATLSRGGLLADVGLGVEYRLTLSRGESGRSFLLFGLRGGYLFMPLSSGWSLEGRDVTGGPDFGLSGPGLLLQVGFGGGSRAP